MAKESKALRITGGTRVFRIWMDLRGIFNYVTSLATITRGFYQNNTFLHGKGNSG